MKIDIETKYSIGDIVVVLETGLKVREGQVKEIIAYVSDDAVSVRYYVDFGGGKETSYSESSIYPSRQNIIDIIMSGGKDE